MKHIIFYSGGIGSWAAAKRVIDTYGKENVILLFTDTLIEDPDLYRFLDETVEAFGAEFVHLKEGRTPWQVFKDVRYLGNSRIAPCTHKLKQEPANKWLTANYEPDECILYLGIDWSEAHRRKGPIENYAPYEVRFPMCEQPYLSKKDIIHELEKTGIEQPRLYKMGFHHNNCAGFCVKAGQGHFANLLKEKPDLYKYHEDKEQELRAFLDKDVSILRRTRNRERFNLTLKELREEIEADQTEQIDFEDIGGCGCFVSYDDSN